MQLLNCPKSETLLEYVSIPDEVSVWKKAGIKLHLKRCADCRISEQSIRVKVEAYFNPAPEITSSLLSVYSRLQRDETLVLKGWKLGELQPQRTLSHRLVQDGWLFRGGLSAAAMAAVLLLVVSVANKGQETTTAQMSVPRVPLAQIRFEDRDSNTVKVRYVQPELLQSMEFETTSSAR